MPAEHLEIHPLNPEPRKLARVVECLREGGIIIYPTDTVYALGCDLHNARSFERLAKLKGIRPDKARFSFICHDLSHLADYANVDNATFRLMKRALPGPFTFLLPAGHALPKFANTNRKTVGIRVPDHAVPRQLVHLLERPLISTSLKDDDDIREYPTDPDEIFEKYEYQVDMFLDSGAGGSVPSTLVDCVDTAPHILRQGLGVLEGFL